ncbi:PstS family phosphate ABC transporter substrate-binding protein [Oscillatoriales cyanobacterium LEGE 11467]|uniref:PstS family phosphate ABC transporter substrate-binding protein n=1 Tax=Zarconia navalis LEGE 11467 TaxID=1828826 RepID=A0A928VTS7_9CYAN|nr:PstS family phosphate ABC transporter substrate-binding protein [Zarconia navalis]MBE9039254.1 PstS family phosphate ABC transporter substrate-binding protein [Zarconia navalis LEGE 11467]
MSQKNETATLAIALLVTLGLIGGGIWLFKTQLGQLFARSSDSPVPEAVDGQTNSSSTGSTVRDSFDRRDLTGIAEVSDIPDGLFNYGGSTTWAPLRPTVDALLQEVLPSFGLRYVNPLNGVPSSGGGIEMLIDDQLAFAQSSRPLEDEEYDRAKQRGLTLKQIPVAIDGIAVAVHPELDVAGVTIAQLKDIYTGKITNWSQVGGPNLPIVPVSRPAESGGTVEFFIDNVLGGQALGANVTLAPTTTQALRRVGDNPGGIYYASAPEVVPQCSIKPLPVGRSPDRLVAPYQEPLVPSQVCPDRRNQLNAAAFQNGDYPITRRLFVIVKQNGQIDERAGNAYAQLLLTEPIQELLAEAGFVSIQ